MEPILISGSSYGWNQCFYKMKSISSTNQQCRSFQEEGETAPQGLEPSVPVFYMVDPVKTQVEGGLIKIFGFRGQTIDVSDQDFLS